MGLGVDSPVRRRDHLAALQEEAALRQLRLAMCTELLLALAQQMLRLNIYIRCLNSVIKEHSPQKEGGGES